MKKVNHTKKDELRPEYGSRKLFLHSILCAALFFAFRESHGVECLNGLDIGPQYVPPNGEYPLDGPGSFGALQDTVTLACLRYVGSIVKSDVETVLIKDAKGNVHKLRIGSWMGEYSGRITAIDRESIYIEQWVPGTDRSRYPSIALYRRIVKFSKQ